MNKSTDVEQALVAGAVAGDTQAFGELYERNIDAIYRYIFFRVENEQEAEDLTEQVFLNTWEALPNYEQRGYAFRSWLYRIAQNAVHDLHRSQRFIANDQDPVLYLEDHTEPTSLEHLIRMEEQHRLIEAVKQLPDLQRNVILFRFVEGMSHEQVAEIVEKSSGACRTIQYRALLALQNSLAGEKDTA